MPTTQSSTGPDSDQLAVSPTGLAAVLTTLGAWSAAPILIHYFADDIDLWTSNGWRYAAAAITWSPLLIALYIRNKVPPNLWRLAALPALFNVLGQVCLAWALYTTTPAVFAFGIRMQIIVVALIAVALVPAERLVVRSPGFIAGAALVITGVVGVVALKPGTDPTSADNPVLGALIAAAAGTFFAAYFFAVKPLMKVASPYTAYAAVSTLSAAALVAVMLVLAEDSGAGAFELNAFQWLLLIASSVVALCMGHSLFYVGLKRLGTTASTAVIQLQPVTIALGSMAMGYDRLTIAQWLAAALAIAGALTILRTQHNMSKRHRKRTTTTQPTDDDTVNDLAALPVSSAGSAGVELPRDNA